MRKNDLNLLCFAYSVFVSDIAEDGVRVIVSVDGRDIMFVTSYESFDFPIHVGMRCVVEGWRTRSGQKYLHCRKINPLQLGEEHRALLNIVVGSFKAI